MRKKVYLHIGHGKTGTSAVQSVLAREHQRLAEQGILYPYHSNFERAARGHISCGNLELSPAQGDWIDGITTVLMKDSSPLTYVFSSEWMFWHLDELIDRLPSIRTDYEPIILLSVRNPLDMLASEYQQSVKRGGYSGSFSEFARSREFQCVHTLRAAALVRRMDQSLLSYRLFNYSALSSQIVPAILEAMTIDKGLYNDVGIVNRSLSGSELLAVRVVNSLMGKNAGMRLSDALVNDLPGIAAEYPALSPEVSAEISKNMTDAVDVLNQRLPVEMPLIVDSGQLPATAPDPLFSLSEEQLEIASLQLMASLFPKESAKVLRSVAQKFLSGEAVEKKEAITLLKIALRANPMASKRIRKKIAEIESSV